MHYRAIKLIYVLLSDRDIRVAIDAKGSSHLDIDSFDPKMIQSSSVDVRLDKLFRVLNNSWYTHIGPKLPQEELTSPYEVPEGQPFILHPGELVPASTLEYLIILPRSAGHLEDKPSLGRLGLTMHSIASFIDPGFSGYITLELSSVASLPTALWLNMKVGQLTLFKMSSPAEVPYGSDKPGPKYQGQRGPTPSRAYLSFRDEE